MWYQIFFNLKHKNNPKGKKKEKVRKKEKRKD